MEYTVRIHQRVMWQIARWGLSDYLLVEVYLALRSELADNPLDHLHRDSEGDGGALYVFARVDPDSPRFQHTFMFRVYFDEDEKHFDIVRGSYWRTLIP
jgi:hypothetical protein